MQRTSEIMSKACAGTLWLAIKGSRKVCLCGQLYKSADGDVTVEANPPPTNVILETSISRITYQL